MPSRRRVLRGSLAAAPVLMTLVSRPVLGSVQCTSCSNMGSLAGSLAAKHYATCSGKAPTNWSTTLMTAWPTPYHPTNTGTIVATPYHCTTTGLFGSTFTGQTMRNVMMLADDGGIHTLGRYCAAALLNARAGLTPALTETVVRRMWNDYVSFGQFEPSAGIHWGAPQIIAYIKSTIG